MKKETAHERYFHDMLPTEIKQSSRVTLGYQDYWRLINRHLKTIYGEYANWEKCIEQYFTSAEYKSNCHYVRHCDEIPILSGADIEQMIREDEVYCDRIEKFLSFFKEIKCNRTNMDLSAVLDIAELLGISPDQKEDGLYRWLISRKGLNCQQKRKIIENIQHNCKLLSLTEDILSSLFEPGLQLSFPTVETAMTQQKGKYYYRGENAYYGSSKPGLYRGGDNDSFGIIKEYANWLLLYEACFFLDQFDAVKYWGPSRVNHLALVQHYGMKTPMMDITSDFKTALFFACCKYKDGRWMPLTKEDFAEKSAYTRVPMGGDPRYGIIYRSPTEITDLKWALADEKGGFDIITPIGYQPFMRCSYQHGYMLPVKAREYDMINDPLFDKFKIELDEELCRWIYEDMECGNKVYPNDDVPNIDRYIQEIRDSRNISQQIFNNFVQELNMTEYQIETLQNKLKQIGYSVVPYRLVRIKDSEIRKINKKYGIDMALSKMHVEPKSKPMIVLSSDTHVNKESD